MSDSVILDLEQLMPLSDALIILSLLSVCTQTQAQPENTLVADIDSESMERGKK